MTATPTRSLPFDARGGLIVLIDPGRATAVDAADLAARAADAGVCGFLVGDSLGNGRDITAHITAIRHAAPGLPVVQFPSSAADLSPEVDAVLFLVLLSGRDPRYLIEEQVRAVEFFDRHPEVRAISTAYVLIDGGRQSTVELVSGTRPLPADARVVAAHVKAGRLMGMQATYLEAGSGAARPVAPGIIAGARDACGGPLFVGGGVTTAAAAHAARAAGADYVVVGTLLERDRSAAVRTLVSALRA